MMEQKKKEKNIFAILAVVCGVLALLLCLPVPFLAIGELISLLMARVPFVSVLVSLCYGIANLMPILGVAAVLVCGIATFFSPKSRTILAAGSAAVAAEKVLWLVLFWIAILLSMIFFATAGFLNLILNALVTVLGLAPVLLFAFVFLAALGKLKGKVVPVMGLVLAGVSVLALLAAAALLLLVRSTTLLQIFTFGMPMQLLISYIMKNLTSMIQDILPLIAEIPMCIGGAFLILAVSKLPKQERVEGEQQELEQEAADQA